MGTTPALQPTLVGVLSSTSTSLSLMEVRGQRQTLTAFETPVALLWLMTETLNSCSNELQRCVASPSCSCVLQLLSLHELLFSL